VVGPRILVGLGLLIRLGLLVSLGLLVISKDCFGRKNSSYRS